MLQKAEHSFQCIPLQLELIYCPVRWGKCARYSLGKQSTGKAAELFCKSYLLVFNNYQVILTATYRRALINGAAAGGTTLAASAQLLFHISQVPMTSLGPHPITFFFFPKVQKVLKSLLDNCQAFIKRTELSFLCYFYLFCQKRHHVALAVVYFKLLSVLSFSGQTPGFLQPVELQHLADCSSGGTGFQAVIPTHSRTALLNFLNVRRHTSLRKSCWGRCMEKSL